MEISVQDKIGSGRQHSLCRNIYVSQYLLALSGSCLLFITQSIHKQSDRKSHPSLSLTKVKEFKWSVKRICLPSTFVHGAKP